MSLSYENDDKDIKSFCIDSRILTPGALFIALKTAKNDGHLFIQEAEQKGAVAALVSNYQDGVSIPQFVVEDTQKALAEAAIKHRNYINPKTIALTGSNGKTTVKEMISSILPDSSFATQGNLNNHLGVPLSVLS